MIYLHRVQWIFIKCVIDAAIVRLFKIFKVVMKNNHKYNNHYFFFQYFFGQFFNEPVITIIDLL